MDSDFAPRVSPGELRPHRWWYAIAGGIALLGLCTGVILAGFGFWSLRSEIPQMRTHFSDGQPTTVTLSKRKPAAIYVRVSQDVNPTSPPFNSTCTGKALDGGSIKVSHASYNISTGNVNGGPDTWLVEHEIKVNRNGKYEITCVPNDRAEAPDHVTYGIGPAPRVGSIFGKIFGTVGALLGGPCCGLLIGGVIALAVGLRRNSHKKRLAAGRAHMAYPPGPLAPPTPTPHPEQPAEEGQQAPPPAEETGTESPEAGPDQTGPDQTGPDREPPDEAPPRPPDA